VRKFGTLIVEAVVSILVGASPALAQHHGGGGWHGGGGSWHGGHEWHGGRWHRGWDSGGIYFGFGPWWGWDAYDYYPYPYAYPYPYTYPYAYPAAPALTAPAPIAPPPSYWYYCRSKKAYYPYVSSCPEAWQQVPTQPPQ
jgi:hypothetical protein